jgi:hypothetical protein
MVALYGKKDTAYLSVAVIACQIQRKNRIKARSVSSGKICSCDYMSNTLADSEEKQNQSQKRE